MATRLIIVALVMSACSKTTRQPSRHRPADIAAMGCSVPGAGGAEPDVEGCKGDAECTAGKLGRCNVRGGGHDPKHNDCEYQQCRIDADCGATAVCECGNAGSYCLPSGCRTDDDCGHNACSPDNTCRGGTGAYYCHTSDDTCVDNSDCHDGTSCVYAPAVAHWTCSNLQCPVG